MTIGVCESCCWDRMSESVGGDVGALKPQQVRVTGSPPSVLIQRNMDLTSCLPACTDTQQHREANRPSQTGDKPAAPHFLSRTLHVSITEVRGRLGGQGDTK